MYAGLTILLHLFSRYACKMFLQLPAEVEEIVLYAETDLSTLSKQGLRLMDRLTARLLLVLLLVGVFVPVALAISATPAHACCMRKPMHGRPSHDAEFQVPPGCCQHDCCRPLTVSQWAHLTSRVRAQVAPAFSNLQAGRQPNCFASSVNHAHSGRAPPQFSIA
jgi:hypothetical protein